MWGGGGVRHWTTAPGQGTIQAQQGCVMVLGFGLGVSQNEC